MKHVLLVFLGGGIGSALRYLIGKALIPYTNSFFLGTFGVNVLGCLLIGLILGLSAKNNLLNNTSVLFLTVGFCGGFTTFSSFALENYGMLKEGQFFTFFWYVLGSVTLGVAAVAAGLWLVRTMS